MQCIMGYINCQRGDFRASLLHHQVRGQRRRIAPGEQHVVWSGCRGIYKGYHMRTPSCAQVARGYGMGQLEKLVLDGWECAIWWVQAVWDWLQAGQILPEQVGVSVSVCHCSPGV